MEKQSMTDIATFFLLQMTALNMLHLVKFDFCSSLILQDTSQQLFYSAKASSVMIICWFCASL